MSDKLKKILIVGGIIADAPKDIVENFTIIDNLTERLGEAIENEFCEDSDIKILKGYSFYWLDDKEINCGKCSECGQFTTDRDKPDMIPVIQTGKLEDGKLICDVCNSQKSDFR